MGADGECAVGLQQLALQRDEPKARGVRGDGPRGRQVADDERAAQELCGQVAKLGMIARDQLLGRRDQTGMLRGHAPFAGLADTAQ